MYEGQLIEYTVKPILGDLANWLLVKAQLTGIFVFRFQAIDKLFGKYKGSLKENQVVVQ